MTLGTCGSGSSPDFHSQLRTSNISANSRQTGRALFPGPLKAAEEPRTGAASLGTEARLPSRARCHGKVPGGAGTAGPCTEGKLPATGSPSQPGRDHSAPTSQRTGTAAPGLLTPAVTETPQPLGAIRSSARPPAQSSFPPHSHAMPTAGGRAPRGPGGPRAERCLTDQVAEPCRLLAVEVEAGEGAGPVLVRPQAHGAPKARGRGGRRAPDGGRRGTNSAGGAAPQRNAAAAPSPARPGQGGDGSAARPGLATAGGFPFPEGQGHARSSGSGRRYPS